MPDPTTPSLCSLAALPDGGEREGRELEALPGDSASLLAVRVGAEVYVYRNRCPHLGSSLNWTRDRFVDAERRHVVCATHGAVFRIEDGLCLSGPCLGDSLEAVAIEVRDGEVYLKSS